MTTKRKRGRPFGTTKPPTERLNLRLKVGTVSALTRHAQAIGHLTLKSWLESFTNQHSTTIWALDDGRRGDKDAHRKRKTRRMAKRQKT